jgi:hypothetical protein
VAYGVCIVNHAQQALLTRLRDIVVETPNSGAVDAAKRPLRISRFAPAVERRAEDGPALVKYVRGKVYAAPSSSYDALIVAGRPDLTVEALVADPDAAWAGEFSDADRAAANQRLGDMIEAHRATTDAAEAQAVTQDRRIMALVNERRIAKGMRELTPAQEADMLKERSAKRVAGA